MKQPQKNSPKKTGNERLLDKRYPRTAPPLSSSLSSSLARAFEQVTRLEDAVDSDSQAGLAASMRLIGGIHRGRTRIWTGLRSQLPALSASPVAKQRRAHVRKAGVTQLVSFLDDNFVGDISEAPD